MRCPDCNKFVSNGEPEVELNSCDLSEDNITGSVQVTIPCGECGTELKTAEISFDVTIEHACDKPMSNAELDRFEIEEEPDPTGTDRYETKDRHGKLIKNPRYQIHYYGFEGTVNVKCHACEQTFDVSVEGEAPASSFEESV